jgi:2,3-bisphosphoglycerate-dependent phosphoglycerate mutase
MITTIYLMRHSKKIDYKIDDKNNDEIQLINEKVILSVAGEKRAELYSNLDELQNVNYIVSSNYVRAMSTAKYIAEINKINLHINEEFGERKFGIDHWDELPDNFYDQQFYDDNYKIKNGESQRDVRERMYNAIINLLSQHKGERIVILSHKTAIIYLLRKWCNIEKNKSYSFNGLDFFNGNFQSPELFKLEFDDKNNLLSIRNIRLE